MSCCLASASDWALDSFFTFRLWDSRHSMVSIYVKNGFASMVVDMHMNRLVIIIVEKFEDVWLKVNRHLEKMLQMTNDFDLYSETQECE